MGFFSRLFQPRADGLAAPEDWTSLPASEASALVLYDEEASRLLAAFVTTSLVMGVLAAGLVIPPLAGLGTASPKVWMDAYLAAFAIAGRLRLVTLDRDFKSYVSHGLDLSLLNP